jgi:hypothetical protein
MGDESAPGSLPRQVRVDQKAHAKLGCWQRAKRLLFSQFTDKSERSPDVVDGDVVFTLISGTMTMTMRVGAVLVTQMIVIWPDLSSLASRSGCLVGLSGDST